MAEVHARAPGRVNIIGEHTDYNDGFVLPCAIAYETQVTATRRADDVVNVDSQFEDGASTHYVRGMLIELQKSGVRLRGADVRITGTVPIGAGLSSSASFEIAFGLAMLANADAQMPPLDLAKLAQRAEIEHVGTRCGIMDQVAVLLAQPDCALFLDTRTLEYRHVPFPAGISVVICNTMVKHELASSAYNERRSECERSVELLRGRYPGIRALRDVDMQQLEAAKSLLPPPLFRRARHVVGENARVLDTVEAMRMGDVSSIGSLLYASHESLRTDYEVSCSELDALVSIAKEFDGTIGARMTGGGFGGCTVNLVRADRADAFRSHISDAFEREMGIVPAVYDGTPSAGACARG